MWDVVVKIILVIIMNKKFLFAFICAIALGTIVGKYFYNETSAKTVFLEDDIIFLQQGVYTNKKNMEENIKRIDPKVVVEDGNKFYVYVGITKNKKNAQKIKAIYEKKGYDIYEKNLSVTGEEFKNNLEQFDLLLEKASKEEEIMTINEVVLANYEQTLQKS